MYYYSGVTPYSPGSLAVEFFVRSSRIHHDLRAPVIGSYCRVFMSGRSPRVLRKSLSRPVGMAVISLGASSLIQSQHFSPLWPLVPSAAETHCNLMALESDSLDDHSELDAAIMGNANIRKPAASYVFFFLDSLNPLRE